MATNKKRPESYPGEQKTVSQFMNEIISAMQETGRVRTSETYLATLHSFMRFTGGRDIVLRHIDTELVNAYEMYLKRQGVSMNTVSFYMRILRAVYNRAAEAYIFAPGNPFRYVYTGIGRTAKRALTFEEIKRLKNLRLARHPSRELARDLFLFSFYTRGMSFIDMAYLRKEDLQSGVLSYRRKKTGQWLFIKWERCMQHIVDKYASASSPYLLPIIKDPEGNIRRQYHARLCVVNHWLKTLGERLSFPHPLTMYVARHSWASIARHRNIPISVISECMGHDSEETTSIYLASLEASILDNANHTVLLGL